MKKMVELVFREYKTKQDTIERSIVSNENIEWITDHLILKHLTNEELSEMWTAVDRYFRNIRLDNTGKNWRTDISHKDFDFYTDTSSAWLEVINMEARRRKEAGTL